MRLYTPKYCSECGDKINEMPRGILSDPRFCSICAADKEFITWAPKIAGFILFVAAAGFCGWLANANGMIGKPAKIAAVTVLKNGSDPKFEPKSEEIPAKALYSADAQGKQDVRAVVEPKIEKQAPLEHKQAEKVFYCGAMTKKGTPCSRRVKTNTRCYQHAGKPSILDKK